MIQFRIFSKEEAIFVEKKLACFALCISLLFVTLAPYSAYAAESVPGEVIVMLRGDVSQARGKAESVARRTGTQEIETFDALSEATGVIFARFRSQERGNGGSVSKFSADPDVLCAMPNYIFQRGNRFADAPNDPSYVSGDLWGLKRIGADVAWTVSSGDAEIRVAVMDTGVDATHEDLRGNVDVARSRNFGNSPTGEPSEDFSDFEGHGTHVAGTIGAVGDNGIGVAGVNWRTSVIALGIIDPATMNETTAAMIGAIDHLLTIFKDEPDIRIPAVNMSFGTYLSQTPLEAIDTPLWHAFKALDNTGQIVFSMSAGNNGFEVGAPAPYELAYGENVQCKVGDYPYPNSYIGLNNVILVGSIRSDDKASEFSNWSAKHVLIAAPGSDILSTVPNDKYELLSGTSMAAPHVTGSLALLAATKPHLSATELKSAILRGANSQVNPDVAETNEMVAGKDLLPVNVSDTTLSAFGLLDIAKSIATDYPAVPVNKITLTHDAVQIEPAAAKTVAVTLEPQTATDRRIEWVVSDDHIAKISSTGMILALEEGETVATARTLDGSDLSASVRIAVKARGTGGSSGCATGAGVLGLFFALAAIYPPLKKRGWLK